MKYHIFRSFVRKNHVGVKIYGKEVSVMIWGLRQLHKISNPLLVVFISTMLHQISPGNTNRRLQRMI